MVFLSIFFHFKKNKKARKMALYSQFSGFFMELLMRFERTTSSLPRMCSAY